VVVDRCDDPLLQEEIWPARFHSLAGAVSSLSCCTLRPHGKARIRTIVTATHTRDQLERAIEILVRVGRRMHILQPE
jgi:hypothetical protein